MRATPARHRPSRPARPGGRCACAFASVLLLAALLARGPLAAGEAGTDAGPNAAPPVDPRAEAQANVAIGNRAMVESNKTPARAVEAALAFVKALHYYQSVEDTEMVCELDADIFWCKKRMNIDEMKSFLAAKGGSAQDAQLIAEADQRVAKPVAAAEAQPYLERADKFAREHPADFSQIATRYFEVAERFPGTEIGTTAQKLSLEAQKRLNAALQQEHDALFETIFTRGPAPPPADRLPLPAMEAVRAAANELKKKYKDDYAIRRSAHKRHFATLLAAAAAAAEGGSPGELRCASFEEAATLALEAKDYLQVLAIAEALAGVFAVEAKERKLLYLNRDHGNPVAAAMIKLLDAPSDKEANLVVGKYCCLEMGRWDVGAPILARGSDAGLKAVAEMELIKPEGAMQQIELADRWSELGMKSFGPTKEQLMARSFHWYAQSYYSLSGITRDRIDKRLEEVGDLMTPTQLNFTWVLSVKQWERLPAKALVIPATRERVDSGVVLARGMRAVAVPHPSDTWTMNYSMYVWDKVPNVFDTNPYGYDDKAKTCRTMRTPQPYTIGATVMAIDKGPASYIGYLIGDEKSAVIPWEKGKGWGMTGLGRIFIGCNLPGNGSGKGQIRVKVVVLEDD
jgi:hypothetical protein